MVRIIIVICTFSRDRSSEDPRLREEHEALLGKLRDLEGQLEEAVEEREGLEGELDAVKRDEDVLRRDVNIVQKVWFL